MENHCIAEVTSCVNHLLKCFVFVYNYTDNGCVEMDKKLTKKQKKHKKTNAGREFWAGITKGRNWVDLETCFCSDSCWFKPKFYIHMRNYSVKIFFNAQVLKAIQLQFRTSNWRTRILRWKQNLSSWRFCLLLTAFFFLSLSIKKFITLSFDVNNSTKKFIALHKTQKLRDHTFRISTWKGAGGVLKFVMCLQILLSLNNRSIVHFCGCWGRGVKKLWMS